MPFSLGPRRSSACNPTVDYSTPDWELHFSFTTGAEAALEERDPLWLGDKLRRTGVGNLGSARWRSRYSHGPRYNIEGLEPIFCIFMVLLAGLILYSYYRSLLKPCLVGGRRRIGVANCRTCGSLTKTSGGEKGKRMDWREGMRGRRPVHAWYSGRSSNWGTSYELHDSNIMYIIMK